MIFILYVDRAFRPVKHFATFLVMCKAKPVAVIVFFVLGEHPAQQVSVIVLLLAVSDCRRMVFDHFLVFVLEQLLTTLQ